MGTLEPDGSVLLGPELADELLKRVFEIDVLICPWCGEKRKFIALITNGKVVRRILEHLGLPATAPSPPRPAPRPSSSSPG